MCTHRKTHGSPSGPTPTTTASSSEHYIDLELDLCGAHAIAGTSTSTTTTTTASSSEHYIDLDLDLCGAHSIAGTSTGTLAGPRDTVTEQRTM